MAALTVVTPIAAAQSDIDPAHKFAWGENIGWSNWYDAGDPPGSEGVYIRDTYLAGFAWGENIGWINLGDGSPADGVRYKNEKGDDFGVNLDADTGELSGFAWAENVGWLNFSGGALADPPQPARLDREACRFRGFVWGENIGWLNLDDGDKFVAPVEGFCERGARGDSNCDGGVDFDDIDCFVAALISEDHWNDCGHGAGCDYTVVNDINQDGSVDFDDIDGFVECLIQGGCP
jgi:hypothetical protein